MTFKIFAAALILVSVTGCASLQPASFADTKPAFDPIAFFGKPVESYGVLEARSGKPSTEIITKTTTTAKEGIVQVEQDLFPENSQPNHRSWQFKKIDEHHYEATANDIEGKATGVLYGNYFTWTFRLKINKGLVQHVKMSQYMYMMPDGKTLIIRSVIRKFGIIVQEITEQFRNT